MKRILFVVAIFSLSLLAISCENKLKQSTGPPLNLVPPPTPKNILVAIGDKSVTLTWSVDSLNGIKRFKIYRSDSSTVQPKLYDSTATATTKYKDGGLQNGKTYFYQISSVSTSNLEGYKSAKISGVPNLYAVVINSGAKFTNTRNVNLGLTGASNSRHVIISEDSLFGDASWQIFSGSKSFALSAGDGTKYVYVKFRDQDGNETSDFYWDDIILDTQASISSVTENTLGLPKTAGQTIHFTVATGETEGNAKVDVGSVTNLQLYDDGSHGDGFANDGTYELDYFISNDVEVEDAIVTGKFTDAAGNQAPNRTAAGKVTILKAPDAVTLLSPFPVPGSHSSIALAWSQSNESDFAAYKIYRSASSGVTLSSTLVANLTGRSATSYTDTALSPNTWYHYKVFVFDANNLSTGSNEDSARTNSDAPPDTVQLLPPSNITSTTISLGWTQSNAVDFYAYQLYRAKTDTVTSDSTLIASINNRATVAYTDTGLEADTTYYYRLYVLDKSGLSSGSNTVSGQTKPYPVPDPVTLFAPSNITQNSMTLNWTQAQSADFSAYRLFRSSSPGVDSTDQLVTSITGLTTLSYSDTGLASGTAYYYRVYVYNTFGNGAGSNQVSAITLPNQPPAAVVLSTPTRVDSTRLKLVWTQNSDPDFASYRIFRDTAPNVDTTDQLITIINQAATTTYTDENLTTGQAYYYRVFVFDKQNLSSGSNEVSGIP